MKQYNTIDYLIVENNKILNNSIPLKYIYIDMINVDVYKVNSCLISYWFG